MLAEKGTVYPSARAILTHRLGCRADWWRLYWSEGGCELTLYQDGEGPQEARDIAEALEWIGGDQPAELNPGTIKWVNNLPDDEREQVLREILAGVIGPEPEGERGEMEEVTNDAGELGEFIRDAMVDYLANVDPYDKVRVRWGSDDTVFWIENATNGKTFEVRVIEQQDELNVYRTPAGCRCCGADLSREGHDRNCENREG